MRVKSEVYLVVLLCLIVKKSYGLKCYTCSVTENDADTRCADDVTSLGSSGITDCDKKYCTITRIDYIDPKGKLSSLNRNCVDKIASNGIIEYSTFRTYQRSCKTDLCNSGSGKSDSRAGTTSLGDKSTIYAPGTGRSSGVMVYGSVLSLLGCLAVLRMY